jgi:protein deglycase
MKKVIVLLAEGFEQIEALAPVDILRRAGFEVTTVSINNSIWVASSHNVKVEADALISKLPVLPADMLVLPGGAGTKNYDAQPLVKTFIDIHVKENKYLAAICAAPSVFGKMGLLEGKRATCFPGYEETLKGASFTGNKVEIDGNIITARGAGCSIEFGLALVTCLAGQTAADDLAKKMMV